MAAVAPLRLLALVFCIFVFFPSDISAQLPQSDTIFANILLMDALRLNDSSLFKQAEIPARKAYDIFLHARGSNQTKTAEAAFQLGISLGSQTKTAEAVLKFREAINIWSAIHPQGDLKTAAGWFELGNILAKNDNLKDALDAHQQCFAIRQQLLADDDLLMAASLFEIGQIIFDRGPQKEAFPYLEKSLQIKTKWYGAESAQLAAELNLVGRNYLYADEFEKAIVMAEKALAIQQKIVPSPLRDISRTYYTLGMCSKKLHRYEDALAYLKKNLELKKIIAPDNIAVLVGTYSEIGATYLAKKDYPQALEYFEKENFIMLQVRGDTQWTYAYTCHDMGRGHFALKNYTTSIIWYQTAIEWFKKHYQRDNEEIAVLLAEMGNSLTEAGEFTDAMAAFQSSAQIFFDNSGPDNVLQYLPESGMGNLYRKMYLRTGDPLSLDHSRAAFRSAEKSIDRLIRFERSPMVRKKWLADTKLIFEQAMATEMLFQHKSNDLSALENAWQLSETMHGFELFATSQEANARRYSGIPEDLLQQEENLRTNMFDLQNERRQLIEGRHLPLTDSLVLDNNARYFQQKEKYAQLVSHFEKNYPDYFNLKYRFSPISIAETQRMLGKDQTLLEYFTGDSSVYIFVIRPDSSRMVAVPRDFPLTEWISQLRHGITGYHTSAQKKPGDYEHYIQVYVQSAQQLYGKLIAPVAALLSEETIIVPDGELNYLPFETLLSGAPKDLSNFKTYPFWVHEKAVGYAGSATILQQMITKKHQVEPDGSLLAFAPFFFGDTTKVAARIDQEMALRKGFQPLPHTGEEILRAQKQVGGRSAVFSGNTATLAEFKKSASGFRILHLATHGKANVRTGEFSFLAFYSPADSLTGGRLYVSDLYNMTLNADLVLLSACETGMGELFEGEGVVSLARAFSFAGAKSVVTSLWSVNDQSSLFLMDDFYRELKLGKTKNKALTNAKRSYMKDHPGAAAHPFFWAGFVGVGDWSKLK